MKKAIKILVVVVLCLAVVSGAAAYLLLNRGVKAAVETFGPKITKTTVKLESVQLSPFSGSGGLNGFVVGNPQGFKDAPAITVKSAKVSLNTSTALTEPVVVNSIRVDGAELGYQTSGGEGNIERIMKNVQEFCGTSEGSSTRKFIIKDLVIANSKLKVSPVLMFGQSIALPVPDVHLSNIGEKTNGATAAEIMKEIMEPLSKELAGPLNEISGSLKGMGGKGAESGAIKNLFGK
ncbi:MAG TPA: hypothetical protein VGP72_25165 [Planctomycetota bacterium]|jgi:hypothetical protein